MKYDTADIVFACVMIVAIPALFGCLGMALYECMELKAALARI